MFALIMLPFIAASAVIAVPTALHTRQTIAPWCEGFGDGVLDTAHNFTLAAYNTTLPNANSTGAPLVFGQAGAVDGASFKVLSTSASYPFNDFPLLSLTNGALLPNGPVQASDANVTAGQELLWVLTTVNLPTPAQIYCAVLDTSPYGGGTGFPRLAVHNDIDSFSLCSLDDPNAQNNVVYKASAINDGSYDFSTCYPVQIQIIGLD
ncbi:hypothetical protein A0H81_06937 [Grifola frondosa]|uniref:Uncharacterized protein n=1 Tax=Grifola frondosa TaxID=5627 RepID=A0A1C7M763_GRIFR|nr:hypothetical protein A0H81_06937 [Grifola frondosa]